MCAVWPAAATQYAARRREEPRSDGRTEQVLCDQPPIILSQGTASARKYSSLSQPLGRSLHKQARTEIYLMLTVYFCQTRELTQGKTGVSFCIAFRPKLIPPPLHLRPSGLCLCFRVAALVVKPSGHHLKLALKMQNFAKAMFKPMR